MSANKTSRCSWAEGSEIMIRYHDKEWGVPVHDDRTHFEFLTLVGAQAGLSWMTILKKRDSYREAYDRFEPEVVAGYTDAKIEQLLQNEKIVRNRLTLRSAVASSRIVVRMRSLTPAPDARGGLDYGRGALGRQLLPEGQAPRGERWRPRWRGWRRTRLRSTAQHFFAGPLTRGG